jgi:hypothetical protein
VTDPGDILDEIAAMLASLKPETIAPQQPPTQPLRRGRPRVTPIHERPIRFMSPRELARNDLIETAQNWDLIVAQKRVESISSATAVTRRANTLTRPSRNRASRIQSLVRLLSDPINSSLRSLTDSNIAGRIATSFPGVNNDTLRKDIAKARKLARVT